MKNEYKIIGIFVVFGLFIWIMNALFTSSSFPGITFWEAMSFDVPAQGMHAVVLIAASVIVFGIVMARLLSQRRRAEDLLRQSERDWRDSFNALEDVMMIIDKDYNIESINDAGLALLGMSREELIGKKCYQVFFDRDGPREDCPCQPASKTKQVESVDRYEEKLDRYCTLKSAPIFDEKGEVVKFVDLRYDITERKQAEEALRESRKRHLDLVNLLPQTIFELDERGNLTFANRQGTLAFGYTLEDIQKGLNALEFFIPEDRDKARKTIYRIMNGEQESGTNEYTAMRKDGSTFPVIVYSSAIVRENEPVGLRGVILDITERKQAEEALRESRKRFRDLVNLLPQTVWEIDTEGTFTFVNQAGFQYHGYTLEDLNVPLNTVQVFIPEDRDRMIENTRRILDGEELGGIEYMALRKDGSTFPVIVYGSPIIHGNETVGLRGVTVDITERKQAEELFRTLASSSPVGIYIVQGGKWQFTNPRFQKYTGYSEDELLNMDSLSIVHNEDREGVRGNAVEMLKGNRLAPYEFRYIRKSGENIWAMETVASIQYQGKRATLGSFMDVTEHKRMEEALRESEENLRAYLESAPDGVYLNDLKGTFLYGNKRAEEIIGYNREELIGSSFLELGLLTEDYLEKAGKLLELNAMGRSTGPDEFELVSRDGSRIWIEINTATIREKGEDIVIGFVRDITERKQMEEREKQLQEELLLSSRLASIGELAAGVAHEINNPLTGIMGYSQRLLRKSTDGEASRYLERIYSETKRVSRIVENLLTFARHHGREKEYADINDILERTLELRSYELKTGNIDLEVELAPGLPRTMVDSQQTEQVFLNLILNAEQAMSGTNRVGKLSVKTQQVKRNIMVSFADNGPGILAEHIDRVFDPFFTTKEARSGTGLGLSLCHGIVTEHGGKIYARSKPGEGSSFFVELPVIPGKG